MQEFNHFGGKISHRNLEFLNLFLIKLYYTSIMDRFTQFLVILSAGCALLAACGAKSSVTSPTENTSTTPMVENTQEKVATITPGVSEKTASPTDVNPEGNTVVITQNMHGETVSVKVGDTIEIQIPTIPTNGFEWQAKNLDPTILAQVGEPVFSADPGPNAAGGIVALKYKAVGPGTTTLNLLYLHPAENGMPSLYKNSFGVTIEVR
jgi:predicted secreted protein